MGIRYEDYRVFPISQSQRNIWELERIYPNSPMNNICISIQIKGRIDIALATRCINHVLEQYPTLLTRFTIINGTPYQFHVPYEEEEFQFFNFSMTDKDGISRWENANAQMVMPICDSPLYQFFIYKCDEKSSGIFIKIHHLISDGWSIVDLANRLSSTYLALLSQTDPDAEIMSSYESHVLREKEYLVSESFMMDQEYWAGQIEKFSGERAFLKKINSANISQAGERRSFRFPELINHAIADFCGKNRVAPFTLYCIALAVHLRRMSGCSHMCLGVPIVNRPEYADKKSGGMYVNTLPFFFETDTNLCAGELALDITEQWYDLLRHQRFPFAEISALSNRINPAGGRLFDIALSYQEGRIFHSSDATVMFSGKWHYSGFQTEQLIIHLSSLDGEDRFAIDYDYLTQLYSREDIEDLHEHILKILSEILSHQQMPIRELNLLNDDELEKVLYTFNRTDGNYSVSTIAEEFLSVVEKTPDTVSLICGGSKITYKGLYEHVLNIASQICMACRGKKEKENIIALCLPRGFDLVASMLAASFSGNAWVILPPELPKARLSHLLKDSGASVLITLSAYTLLFEGDEVPVLLLDCLPEKGRADGLPVRLCGSDLAYVGYTSGSTGMPKGVMIEQASLTNFSRAMDAIYSNGVILSFCYTGFDVFILETISALLCGRTVILALDEQCNDPLALAGLIKKYAVKFFAITPLRLEAYLSNPEFAQALINMEGIVCGGEPLMGDLVRKLEQVTKARIYNQYGPSETTIGVSCKCVNNSHSFSAGKPMANCSLYVLDEYLNPLPIGAVGDLYIGGACVGRGYLNHDEETQNSFLINRFEVDRHMYRSGDTASWDKYGEINIVGRHDSQVKLNGNRVEPQEIASVLLMYPQVAQAVVNVSKKENGGYMSAAYYTSVEDIEEDRLYEFCGSYLPTYMIPQFFIRIESVPLTANGKIDLKSLPGPSQKAGGVKPLTKTQGLVLSVFKNVLGRIDLTIDSPYFQSGGDSLNALAVISELSRITGAKIRVSDLRGLSTPANIAEKIDKNVCGAEYEKPPGNRLFPTARKAYPLTSIQKSILFSSFLDPTGIAYNMPGSFSLPLDTDIKRLEDAFCHLIAEEDILRTSFEFEGSDAVARVRDSAGFTLEKISAESYDEAYKAFVRPFDLTSPPLIRAGLWPGNERFVLLLDVHHIINDGEGTPILLSKLDMLYRGEELQNHGLSYKDYVCYMQENEEQNTQINYWKKKLSGLGERLALPTDFPRAEDFDHKGASVSLRLDPDLSERVDKFCLENNLTVYTLFSAAYGILLSALSGQNDFVIGTPVAGRVLPETRNMLGPFIHTLPLRFRINREISAAEYLEAVSLDVTDMLDNADIDQEKCLSAAGIERGSGYEGLYGVMFSMRPDYENSFTLDGRKMAYVPAIIGSAKMDLVLEAVKNYREYAFFFEYATSLFCSSTIEFYGRSLMTVVENIIKNPEKRIEEIEIVSPRDKEELFNASSGEIVQYNDLVIDAMADSYAYFFPNADAILFGDERISYDEFRIRSDSVAAQLVSCGVKHGDVVGVFCDRTPDLICGLFGILKCGAAYLPLTTQLPRGRIDQMLGVAGVKTVLCARESAEIDGEKYTKCIISDELFEFSTVANRHTTDTAQVLFTSGSTGQPKGIMISHRSLSSLLSNLKQMYTGGGVEKGVLCSSSVLFDSFTMEVVIPLALGISVVMADQTEMMTPWLLAECIQKNNVQAMFSTPSRMRVLLGDAPFMESLSMLKVLLLGGEAMPSALAQKLCSVCGGEVYNLYGPAEATVFATSWRVKDGEIPTIGYPVPNAKVYILDEKMQPAIPTVCGEIYIGGDCLSKGYIGRPDLTQTAFVNDLFMPGKKLYRTGDMARMLCDGRIDFLGRRDYQVKLNGQRIELEEITGGIMCTGMVLNAAVTVMKGPNEGTGDVLRGLVVPHMGKEFDESALRAELAKTLPRYMIPAEIIVVDEIPLTATGKTDVKAIIAMGKDVCVDREIKNISDQTADMNQAAENMNKDIERADINDRRAVRSVLNCLWKEVLAVEEIDEDRSFFEQGGTSLAAMNLLIQYFKQGWRIKLGTFYEKPTLNEQLDLVCEIHEQKQSPSAKPEKELKDRIERILVTGVTGFLGAHIVYELISGGISEIYCLVRGEKARVYDTLGYYFGGEWIEDNYDKIIPVAGDVGDYRLGFGNEEYLSLSEKIGTVYHCAGDVRHYMDEDDAMRTNVIGTKNVVEFCEKAGAYLGFISTLSVGGERIVHDYDERYVGLQEVEFDERCFDIGQNWRDNVYVRSKFFAETELCKAAENGLKIKILRVGRLVGRASDGKFQRNRESNYFYNVISGTLLIGAVPDEFYDMTLDITPVDACAKAAVLMMDGETGVAHLANPYTTTIGIIAEALLESIAPDDAEKPVSLKRLGMEEFTGLVLGSSGKPFQSAAMLNSTLNIPIAEDIRVKIVCNKTNEELERRGFSWEVPDVANVLREFIDGKVVGTV